LTTQTPALVDGVGRPLVIVVTTGQAGDSPALPKLLAGLRVPRIGPGRPRTTPQTVRADQGVLRAGAPHALRARGVKVVIPERADQIANRKNRGSPGGRPVDFDTEDYKNRNVVERAFNRLKNWRGLATRYEKHPSSTAAAWSSPRSSCG